MTRLQLVSALLVLLALLGWSSAQSNLCDPNRGCEAATPPGCEPIPDCPPIVTTPVYTPPMIVEADQGWGEDWGPRPVLHVPPAGPPAPPRGVVFVPSEPAPPVHPPPPPLKRKPAPPLAPLPPGPPAPRTPVIVFNDEASYATEPVVVVPPTLGEEVLGPDIVSVPAVRPPVEEVVADAYIEPAPRVVEIAPVIVEEPEILTRETVVVEQTPTTEIAPTIVQALPVQPEIQPVPVVETQIAPVVVQPEPIIVEEEVLIRQPPPPPPMVLPAHCVEGQDKSICDLNPLTVRLEEMRPDGWAGMTELICHGADFQWALFPVEGGNVMTHRIEIYPTDADCFEWVELNYLVNPKFPDDLNSRTGKPMWDGTLRMRDLRAAEDLLKGDRPPAFDLAIPDRLQQGDNLWIQFGICTVEGCFADSQLYHVAV